MTQSHTRCRKRLDAVTMTNTAITFAAGGESFSAEIVGQLAFQTDDGFLVLRDSQAEQGWYMSRREAKVFHRWLARQLKGGIATAMNDRGFASMDREKQLAVASKGGRAGHAKGTAHEWTQEEAREAGRRGGRATQQKRRERVAAVAATS